MAPQVAGLEVVSTNTSCTTALHRCTTVVLVMLRFIPYECLPGNAVCCCTTIRVCTVFSALRSSVMSCMHMPARMMPGPQLCCPCMRYTCTPGLLVCLCVVGGACCAVSVCDQGCTMPSRVLNCRRHCAKAKCGTCRLVPYIVRSNATASSGWLEMSHCAFRP